MFATTHEKEMTKYDGEKSPNFHDF